MSPTLHKYKNSLGLFNFHGDVKAKIKFGVSCHTKKKQYTKLDTCSRVYSIYLL